MRKPSPSFGTCMPRLFSILIAVSLATSSVVSGDEAVRKADEKSQLQKKSSDVPRRALRRELLQRVKKDQEARMKILEWMRTRAITDGAKLKQSDEPQIIELRKIDKENREWLKKIVAESGWPVASQVGVDGAHAAWLLLQHADDDPKFQKQCLTLMREAAKGEVAPVDIAYLTDRVMIKESGKQVYGTQLRFVDGECEPLPLSDPDRVDQLRKEAGLQPLEQYLKFAEKMYKGATPKPPAKSGKKPTGKAG